MTSSILISNIELSLSIYSDNISSLCQIFADSSEIREKRQQELLKIIEDSQWSDENYKRYNLYDYHFEWILIHAVIISGFSYFENFMRSISLITEKYYGDHIKMKDIKGEGNLDNYRKYIYLIGNIRFADEKNYLWKQIDEFRIIRNAIIHENGYITKRLSKINEHKLYFRPSKKYIRIRNFGFMNDFSKTSIEYMKEISSELINKLSRN